MNYKTLSIIFLSIFIGIAVPISIENIFSLFSLTISMCLILFFKKKSKTWFNSATFILVIYIVGYLVRYYYLVKVENKVFLPESDIFKSLVISFLAVIICILGIYVSKLKRPNLNLNVQLNDKQTKILLIVSGIFNVTNVIILILFFGGIDNFFGLLSNRTKNFEGLNWIFSGISCMVMASLIVYGLNPQYARKKIFKVYTLIGFLFLFFTGSRILMLLSLMNFLVISEYVRKKRIKLSKIIAVTLSFLVFYMAYFIIFRTYLPTGSWDYFNANSKELLINTVMNGGTGFLDGLVVVTSYMPYPVELLYGSTFLGVITMLIPRAIFPGKYPLGSAVYNYLFNSDQYSSGTGQNPTLMGEFYMNFGFLGLFVCMFLFGISLGFLEMWKEEGIKNKTLVPAIIYSLIFPSILLYMKSGLGTATFYRLLFPFMLNFVIVILLNKGKIYLLRGKYNG